MSKIWMITGAGRGIGAEIAHAALAAGQEELAMRFSRRTDNPFEGVEYELSRTGQPILKGTSAWFECHNRSRYPEGDHVIFVGEVEECAVHPQSALLFHSGRFGETG